jgi:hypothetical protein
MATLEEALAGAKRLHQKGELHQAEQIYRQLLLDNPNIAEAYHLLGLIAHQRGDHAMAIDLIGVRELEQFFLEVHEKHSAQSP